MRIVNNATKAMQNDSCFIGKLASASVTVRDYLLSLPLSTMWLEFYIVTTYSNNSTNQL